MCSQRLDQPFLYILFIMRLYRYYWLDRWNTHLLLFPLFRIIISYILSLFLLISIFFYFLSVSFLLFTFHFIQLYCYFFCNAFAMFCCWLSTSWWLGLMGRFVTNGGLGRRTGEKDWGRKVREAGMGHFFVLICFSCNCNYFTFAAILCLCAHW